MKKFNSASPQKTAPQSDKITEEEFDQFYSGKDFQTVLEFIKTGHYDGNPLDEKVVYSITEQAGIKLFIIKFNRRTYRRALKMMQACHDNGMTTPAIFVDATIVKAWGLTIVDPVSLAEPTPEEIAGAYVLMEGHGRLHAWLFEQILADKKKKEGKEDYVPFEFNFIYRKYNSPKDFGNAYNSTNADMTRTTHKDRLNIAADRCKDPLVNEYFRKCREDKVISKAAYFWTFGRELTTKEVTQITTGEKSAPTFDKEITSALQQIYDAFKIKFGSEGAKKIYRGVPAAMWAATKVKAGVNDELVTSIIDKVKKIDNDSYTAIITATTNSKKRVKKEDVIKQQLDRMLDDSTKPA